MDVSLRSPPLPPGWAYQPPGVVRPYIPLGGSPPGAVAIAGAGDDQNIQKVAMIWDLVVRPALGPRPRGLAYTRQLLAEILGGLPKKTLNGYAQAAMAVRIFEWVKGRIRNVKDPVGKEHFQQLPALVAGGVGNCDDFTAILTALFSGWPCGAFCQAMLVGRIHPSFGWVPKKLQAPETLWFQGLGVVVPERFERPTLRFVVPPECRPLAGLRDLGLPFESQT